MTSINITYKNISMPKQCAINISRIKQYEINCHYIFITHTVPLLVIMLTVVDLSHVIVVCNSLYLRSLNCSWFIHIIARHRFQPEA